MGKVTLTLSNAFAAAGALTVNLGEIDLGGLLSNVGQVALNGGTISNGTLQSLVGFALTSGSVSATLAGSAALTKNGSGTAFLTGFNSYTGGTTINAGTLLLGAENALSITGGVTLTGGSLDLGGFSISTGALLLADGILRNGTLSASAFDLRKGTIDASLVGTGSVTKTTADTVLLNGIISTSGDLIISSGTLLLGAADRLSDSIRVRMELNGALDLGGFSERVGRLRLDGGAVRNGTIEASVYEVASGDLAISLTGAAALEKVSDGSASGGISTLFNVNTYTGGTTVSAGTLKLGGDDRLNTAGSLTVAGGSFDLGGFSQHESVLTMTAAPAGDEVAEERATGQRSLTVAPGSSRTEASADEARAGPR
jgi:autotransporter-associated beta strand protein